MSCEHKNIVPPPPGKHLRICLDCCKRLIECDGCSEKMVAGPHVTSSGWREHGWRNPDGSLSRTTLCPECESDRTPL